MYVCMYVCMYVRLKKMYVRSFECTIVKVQAMKAYGAVKV
jgi:hypothetical protein